MLLKNVFMCEYVCVLGLLFSAPDIMVCEAQSVPGDVVMTHSSSFPATAQSFQLQPQPSHIHTHKTLRSARTCRMHTNQVMPSYMLAHKPSTRKDLKHMLLLKPNKSVSSKCDMSQSDHVNPCTEPNQNPAHFIQPSFV